MQADGNTPVLFFLIGLTFVGLIVTLTVRAARQRTKGMAAVAQQIGFTFLGNDWRGPALSPRFKISLLQRTRGHFGNVMIGASGELDAAVCDYTYGQGKSSVSLTLVCFSQKMELPPFELRPEGFFDKIGDAISNNDQDFESNPEFSRRYHLRTPDENRIRKLFDPGLLTYFEQVSPDIKWHVESSGTSLIIYKGRRRVSPSDIPNLVNDASAIARLILRSCEMNLKKGEGGLPS